MTSLFALWTLDPSAARKELRQALVDYDGNVTHTAEFLGISRRTMDRWLQRADLREFAAELRDRWLRENFPR